MTAATACSTLSGRRVLSSPEAIRHRRGHGHVRWALAGARVVLMARREAELQAAVAATARRTASTANTWVAADLAATGTLADGGRGRPAGHALGGVDILVNGAGVNLRQPFGEVTPEAWQTQIALHLGAPFFLTQALAPSGMALRGWGRIINIASLQSYRAFADSAPYGAGKGGVVQLTRAIAQAWGGQRHHLQCHWPRLLPDGADRAGVRRRGARRERHAKQHLQSAATASSRTCTAPPCSWPATPARTSPARP
jgi:gluconate 5-dehydrogenase